MVNILNGGSMPEETKDSGVYIYAKSDILRKLHVRSLSQIRKLCI